MTRHTPAQVRSTNIHRRHRPTSRSIAAIGLASLTGLALPLTLTNPANAQVTNETAFLDTVNAQRLAGRSCGANGYSGPVPAVKIDVRLTAAARLHSADIAARRTLSHLGSNGSTLLQRITAQGYLGSAGEIVANGFPNGVSLAQAMLSNSAACAALMKASLRDVALGVAAPNNIPYWTAVLATPADTPPTTVTPTTVATTAAPVATTVPVTLAPTTAPPPTAPPATTPPPPPTTPTVTTPPVTSPPPTTPPPTTPPPTTPPPTVAPITVAPTTTPPVTAPPSTPPPSNATAAAYLDAINAQRSGVHTCGSYGTFGPAAPLRWDTRLAASAAAHSADQASHGVISHSGSDGSDMGVRIQRQGYYPFATWGENVAYWYPNLTSVMNGWMTSPGHCRNIMFGGFKDVGMAVAYSPSGVPYWTQDFATLR